MTPDHSQNFSTKSQQKLEKIILHSNKSQTPIYQAHDLAVYFQAGEKV
jgi:hypothetical protein